MGPTRPVVRRGWDQPAWVSIEDGTNPPGCPSRMGPTRLGVRRGWDQPAWVSVEDGTNPPGCPPKMGPTCLVVRRRQDQPARLSAEVATFVAEDAIRPIAEDETNPGWLSPGDERT
uniref:Uncharacterized protein n=1 Tax=Anopheles coluzzii TaxID=1518534 RepID=A0A8W7PD87_ANOCL